MTTHSTETEFNLDTETDILASVHPKPAAKIRGVWCVVDSTIHRADDQGAFTLVSLSQATDEGDPMAEAYVDGHVDFAGLIGVLADLSRGHEPAGVDVNWANSFGQVA